VDCRFQPFGSCHRPRGVTGPRSPLAFSLRPDSAFLRRLAYAGARYGPRFWVEYSPKVFGAAFALALGETRQRVAGNLRRVHGPRDFWSEQLDTVATFTSYASCLAEALGAERTEARQARIRLLGETHLRAALDAGRGVVLVTAHVGPWDSAARLLARDFAADVAVVMLAEPDLRARALHDSMRARNGVRIVHVGARRLAALAARARGRDRRHPARSHSTRWSHARNRAVWAMRANSRRPISTGRIVGRSGRANLCAPDGLLRIRIFDQRSHSRGSWGGARGFARRCKPRRAGHARVHPTPPHSVVSLRKPRKKS
jgi:hypothetical protein